MLDLQTLHRCLGGEISKGQLLCAGPGHSQTDRSLSIKIDSSAPGGFLYHSFAGDDAKQCADYIRQKCGLPAFEPNGQRRRRSSDEVAKLLHTAVLSQQQERPNGVLTASYQYTDADGKLLYEVLRYEPKTFRQRRPDPLRSGSWIWNLDSVRRVPYRWPYILEHPDGTILYLEGEKDVDREIQDWGYPATTTASGKWTQDCVEAFRGRDVLIIPDNDPTGEKKGLEAASRLRSIAASIKIVRLPGLAEGGDISDWLDAGHTIEEFEDVCYQTPNWIPDDTKGVGAPAEENIAPAAAVEAPEAIPATLPSSSSPPPLPLPLPSPSPPSSPWHYHSETAAIATPWLIKNILPETGTGLIAGQWGTYKSTVALDIAVSVATGICFANRFRVKRQGGVVYFALEGIGGLESRLNAIAAARGSSGPLPFIYRSDCPELIGHNAIIKIGALIDTATKALKSKHGADLALVFVDTLITAAGYTRAGDDNDAAVAQRVMTMLAGLSKRFNALVVGIDHFREGRPCRRGAGAAGRS